MTITEFFARLDDIPSSLRAYICLTAHVVAKYQGRQYRDSGEPYLEHVFDVMWQLMGMKMDDEVIIAGGLHDLIEDTSLTAEVLAEHFGQRVAFLIEGVSKKPKELFPDKQARLEEFHQRLVTCARVDFAVLFIRFADRLHNLVTLHGLNHDPLKQQRIAQETLDFYLPLVRGEAKILVPKSLHRFLNLYAWKMEHSAKVFLVKAPS